MKVFFSSPEFDAQLLRTMGYTYYGGADIGECMTTAGRIKESDFESWHKEWKEIADTVFIAGEKSLEQGLIVSACEAFLRASNYYRTCYFFLLGTDDPRIVEAYKLHASSFDKAIKLFACTPEDLEIPFENTRLPGHFYKYDSSSTRRPTLIVTGGYDGTRQELFFLAAAAALRRGYNVFAFDGPGQGKLMIEENIPMRHDWETIIKPIVDALLKRKDVLPDKIALCGLSFGGILAPRAAAFETRLAALIVNPGQIEVLQSIKKSFPEAAEHLERGDTKGISTIVTQAMSNKMQAQKFKAKMWIHKVETAVELIKEWQKYNLRDVLDQVRAPSLICDSENETFSAGQAKELYDALQCLKKYVLFTNAEGAGAHCECGALSLAHEVIFNWLDRVIHAPETLEQAEEIEKKTAGR